MLLSSNFILNRYSLLRFMSRFNTVVNTSFPNRTKKANEWTIYPYIHQWSNVVNVADQFEEVRIPDVDPAQIPEGADFSMSAGDFVEAFTENEGTQYPVLSRTTRTHPFCLR